MRRFVPRAAMGAALVLSAAACAAGTATSGGSASGGAEGGRYEVLVADVQTQGGASERDAQRVASQLRNMVREMLTHTAVDPKLVANAQKQYEVAQLDTITATQLAQQIGAENVLWTEMSQGGAGLIADVKFIDVRSGDVIRIDDITAPNANELAQAIFTGVEGKVQALAQASYCNDYLSSSQFDRALETCEAALAVVPTSTAALYGKATALLNLERYEESLRTYDTLLEIDDTNSDALLGAGLAASNLTRSDAALGFYNRYLELNPGNIQVRMTVASDIANTGDYLSAYKVLEPAIDAEENRDNPEFQRYLFSLATAAGTRVRDAEGDAAARPYFDTALRAYGQAFSTDSVRPDVNQLSQAIAVNRALGRTEEALRIAREATVQYDTVPAVWSQYASTLAEAGQNAEAAQAFTRVIELDPNAENAFMRRGMARLAAGQRQQALADLQQAAERGNQEDVARVLFSEGNKAMQAGRYGEAANLLETASRYAGSDLRPQIVFFHGWVLFKQGESIAKANTQGNLAQAREALGLFQRALPLVRAGANAQKADAISGIQQYIANQEAIIRAGSR